MIDESFIRQAVACPGGTLYAIKPGDSLFSLAPRFGTTIAAIQAANPGLDPRNLQLGQTICIPVAPAPGGCPGGFFYSVTISDTYFSIARRFGIAVQALAAANPGVNPNTLQIGQRICVPAPGPPPFQECPGRLYAIQAGDTLIGIGQRFGYTLDALLIVNPGIDPNNLQIGQVICLPPSPGAGPFACFGGSIYRVQPGDTLYAIAQRFGVPFNDLLTANPQITNPNAIQIGEPVCIPR